MTKFLRSRILRWVFGAVGAVLALTPHVHAQMTGRSGRTVSDRPAVLNTALPTDESGQTYGGQPTNIDPILNPVDASVDLVFTPVTPCRIIDTRVAGGAIAAGTTRNFLASGGPYTTQGGSSGSCGIPFPAAVAVVINYVAVSPAGAGDLRVTPFGTAMPTASVINYAAVGGLAVANGVATSICGDISCVFDITIQADVSATHLVADVMGYYRDITCQAGTTKALGACFETALRTAATIFNASDTCRTATGRLATGLELRSLRGGNPLTLDTTGEWTDSVYFDTGGLGFGGMVIANGGSFTQVGTLTSHPFRCVYRSLP